MQTTHERKITMAFEHEFGVGFARDKECPPPQPPPPHPQHLRDEPIITNKVYDSCRRQDCLEVVARAAEPVYIDGVEIKEGEVIPVPDGAGSVTTEGFTVKKIMIVDKEPSPFKKGFWDVQVKVVFEYMLVFRKCDKDIILCVKANSIHNQKYCLFGSATSDFVAVTDLFNGETFNNEAPNVWIDAKAVALKAEFRCRHCDRKPIDVLVTVGLFCIFKLSRMVCLSVRSRGFCIPRECEDCNPTDPCKFFAGLDFPMNNFAPPERLIS